MHYRCVDWLFAYGSLIDGRAPMAVRRKLKQHLIAAYPAEIPARLATTRAWYPAAVFDPESRLAGLVLQLRRARALWPLLDAYEHAHRSGRSEFVRMRLAASLPNGHTVDAWVYLLRGQAKRRP